MKRLLTIILLGLSLAASAQKGLEINRVFGGKYINDPSVTETLMSGNQKFLVKHNMSTLATFRGISAKYAPIIQPLVLADGTHATARNVRYKNGKLQYAFYILAPNEENSVKNNRYIYYINNETAKNPSVILIYFDGKLKPNQAEALIKTLSE